MWKAYVMEFPNKKFVYNAKTERQLQYSTRAENRLR